MPSDTTGGGMGPSPESRLKRHSTMVNFLKTGLNKPCLNGLSLSFPNLNISCRKPNDRVSEIKHYQMSWSVMKQICSVLRLGPVSCLTQEGAEVTINKPVKRAQMSLEEEITNFIAAENGKDRLRRAWKNRSREQDPPKDLALAVSVGQNIGMLCFLLSFIKRGNEESDRYLARSRTTLFGSNSLAGRRLANVVIAHGMKEGLKFGLFGFSLAFAFIASWRVVSIYYNSSAPWTLGLAAGTTISIWKASLGLRGMVGGFIVGNILGTMVGVPAWLFLNRAGMTQQDLSFKHVEQIIVMQREYRKHAPAELDDEDEMVD